MANEDVIRRKLVKISEYLGELEPITKFSLEEYRQNYFTKHTAERLIELIVEAAVDINGLIAVELGESPPQTYYSSFLKLEEIGILPEELANKLAPFAGLRNRLVHEYEDIRDSLVYKNTKNIVALLPEYLQKIEDLLEKWRKTQKT